MQKNISNNLITKHPDLVMQDMKMDGRALQDIPAELRTPELCLTAVKEAGYALKYVPSKLQMEHPEISVAAVEQNGWLMEYVPEEELISNLKLLKVRYNIIYEVLKLNCYIPRLRITKSSKMICKLIANNSPVRANEIRQEKSNIIPDDLCQIIGEYAMNDNRRCYCCR